MRKGIIGLSLSLTIALIPAYSATPPKAGSVCSKQGITKTYQGKKFTCIKSGKKLVWNKGVVVKNQVQTNSQNPVVSPVPSPVPSQTAGLTTPIALNLLNISSTHPFSAQQGSIINETLKIASDLMIEQVTGQLYSSNQANLISATVFLESRIKNESIWKLTFELVKTIPAGRYTKVFTAQAAGGQKATFYEATFEILPSNVISIPSPSPSRTKQADPTFLAYEKLRSEARNQVSPIKKIATIQDLPGRFLVAPTVPDQIKKIRSEELSFAYAYWKSILNSDKLTIILWDTNSGSWADSTYDSIKGNYNAGEKLSTKAPTMDRCTSATAFNFFNTEDNYVITSCENIDYVNKFPFRMPHEYTHLVQNSFRMFDGTTRYALWVIEGGAHYYGQIIGYASDDAAINANINDFLSAYEYWGGIKQIGEYFRNSSTEAFVDFMKSIEYTPSSPKETEAAYVFGAFATEYLIGKYGESKLLNFWREFQNSQNISANFLRIFNTELNDFYRELRGYVIYCLGEAGR